MFHQKSKEKMLHDYFKDITDEEEKKMKREIIYYIRKVGVKFNALLPPKKMWEEPNEIYEKFFLKDREGNIKPNYDQYLMDIREMLGYDRPLRLAAQIILKKIKSIDPVPALIIGYEISSFPIIGAILALNDVFFPDEPLEACYIRKNRKDVGLRRVIEGSRNYAGKDAVFIDDIINRGKTLKNAEEFAIFNKINLVKAFFVLSHVEAGKVKVSFPYEAIVNFKEVADYAVKTSEKIREKKNYQIDNSTREKPMYGKIDADPLSKVDVLALEDNKALTREDIELVKLARDTVIMSVLSGQKKIPTMNIDGKGSFGYTPFLGKYNEKPGTVFVRINKREYYGGKWINRMRGCMSNAVMKSNRTYAENTISSALLTSTKSMKVNADGPCSIFHKPIWEEELGSLSFFVYVIDKIEKTDAKSIEELEKEGHDVTKHGLIAECKDFRGTLLGGLSYYPTLEQQMEGVLGKMSNGPRFKTHKISDVQLYRIYGKWLWLPERPMKYYFDHI